MAWRGQPRSRALVPKSEQKRAAARRQGRRRRRGAGGGKPPSGGGGDKYASNYYAIDKEFTSNLQDSVALRPGRHRGVDAVRRSVIENLKTNEIAVRSAVLMALGDATEDEVFTSRGQEATASCG